MKQIFFKKIHFLAQAEIHTPRTNITHPPSSFAFRSAPTWPTEPPQRQLPSGAPVRIPEVMELVHDHLGPQGNAQRVSGNGWETPWGSFIGSFRKHTENGFPLYRFLCHLSLLHLLVVFSPKPTSTWC